MAVKKFSEIAAASTGFVTGESILGVQAGPTDVLFSKAQVFNPPIVVTDTSNPSTSTLTLTGATALTTSQPVLNMTQTWNAGGVVFSGLKLNVTNTASAAGSTLLDLQTGGANTFKVITGSAATAVPSIQVGSGSTTSAGWILGYNGASGEAGIWQTGFTPTTTNYILWANASGNVRLRAPSNSFCVIGCNASDVVVVRAGNLDLNSSTFTYSITQDTWLSRGGAAATWLLGAADGATAVAQTTQVQSVAAGNSNVSGADWTFQGSRGTGTGVGGSIIFNLAPAGTTGTSQNAATEKFRITTSGKLVSATGPLSGIMIGETTVANTGLEVVGTSAFLESTGSILLSMNRGGNKTFCVTSDGGFVWGNSTTNANPSVATQNTALSSPAAATLQFGWVDVAAPIAQTIQVQSVVAGTSNTAGALWTLQGSRGTGTGAGGDIAIKTAPAGTTGTSQNAAAEVIRILAVGNMKFTNAANFSANGTVATVLGSLGPTGANTTVQKWLTFVDNGGTTCYVPCF